MAATDFKAMTRRGTCRSCRKRRLLDQTSHLCGICHISQASIWLSGSRQSQTPPATAASTSTALTQVGTRSMERVQLYSDFVNETHRTDSPSTEERNRVMTISYLTNLQSTDVLSPMLTTAIDALSWAHAGAVHDDKRLTHASHAAYGKVLTSLRKVIESPSQAGRPAHWEVLATVMLMSIVDTTLNNDSGTADGENAWLTHFWGAQQYLSTIGASSLDLEHVVSKVMTFSIYQSVILIGIAKRKTIDLRAPQWTAERAPDEEYDSKRPWGVVEMQHRFMIFSPVAGLLAETDRSIESPGSNSLPQLHSLWQRLEHSRERVAQCVAEGLAHTTATPISDATFDFNIEDHCAISASAAFDTVLSFDVLDAGVYYSCTVMILLIVDCTIIRLRHFLPHVSTFACQRSEQETERDAFELATQLGQCIHYFAKLDSLAYAHFTVLFLTLAQNVFETQGARRELGWSQACLIAVTARLKRISAMRRPTLCRIGNLPPGIQQAGLYRSVWNEDNRQLLECPMRALPAPDTPNTTTSDTVD